ncbi:MAG: pancreas/duodenum homeobox protein 1 [Desulfarculus sp.]|nr:hypothetical protein [Pseudomonadota bacterium]MBU4596577.1 hypothetical protein [Pseudomonadota bacterium]MBV1717603.1 pancreas/duodenum homeobox protein 1 [Desulfarculus sp.]MBV1736820.1 pancreas/duodenum homeobox protein 1 [Desulfarculus sp.]MBV1751550.1 pancreas/duodenum homeobox protein 1 [Desulfarculus sp.]
MSGNGKICDEQTLAQLIPAGKADDFFEALYGDASEGAYDFELVCRSEQGGRVELELLLHQRPGKCLACNLTYGLPQVLGRHPVLNLKGVVQRVCELAGADPARATWSLGHTRVISNQVHAIPITIEMQG